MNLTQQQVAAIETAARSMPDPSWHDGFVRAVRDKLAGDAPTNAAVNAAIKLTFDEVGVTSPILPEE